MTAKHGMSCGIFTMSEKSSLVTTRSVTGRVLAILLPAALAIVISCSGDDKPDETVTVTPRDLTADSTRVAGTIDRLFNQSTMSTAVDSLVVLPESLVVAQLTYACRHEMRFSEMLPKGLAHQVLLRREAAKYDDGFETFMESLADTNNRGVALIGLQRETPERHWEELGKRLEPEFADTTDSDDWRELVLATLIKINYLPPSIIARAETSLGAIYFEPRLRRTSARAIIHSCGIDSALTIFETLDAPGKAESIAAMVGARAHGVFDPSSPTKRQQRITAFVLDALVKTRSSSRAMALRAIRPLMGDEMFIVDGDSYRTEPKLLSALRQAIPTETSPLVKADLTEALKRLENVSDKESMEKVFEKFEPEGVRKLE